MNEYLIPLGIVFIFVGILLISVGTIFGSGTTSNTKVAFGGFIGPLPFGFANDKGVLYALIGMMAFVFVLWFVMRIVFKF